MHSGWECSPDLQHQIWTSTRFKTKSETGWKLCQNKVFWRCRSDCSAFILYCRTIKYEVPLFYFVLFSLLMICVSDGWMTPHQRSSALFFSCAVSLRFRAACLSSLWQRSSGSFIRREIKSSSTATACWECFIFARGNKRSFFQIHPLRQRKSFNFLLSHVSMWWCRQK